MLNFRERHLATQLNGGLLELYRPKAHPIELLCNLWRLYEMFQFSMRKFYGDYVVYALARRWRKGIVVDPIADRPFLVCLVLYVHHSNHFAFTCVRRDTTHKVRFRNTIGKEKGGDHTTGGVKSGDGEEKGCTYRFAVLQRPG